MNDIYFACRTCKSYIDAGYRWAYWTLEDRGLIHRGELVSIDDVLEAEDYWNVEAESWLSEHLPRVRAYLIRHQAHDVIFGEDQSFWDLDDPGTFLEWLNEDEPKRAELSPRYCAERLQLERWDDVVAYVERQAFQPWWWKIPSVFDMARAKFERLVTG